ncbi:MAG: hypothetical protein HY619_07870 [Thaumarchaeota archaeon]|nr:hypothetical protein [Nitrososphaerota archaeon]
MPREGWKSVSIKEEYFGQLKSRADKEHRSVAGYLEKMLLDKRILKPLQEVSA